MDDRVFYEVCANCGKPYGEHLIHDGNKCSYGSITGWFPKAIADALDNIRDDDAVPLDPMARGKA